MGTCYVVFKGKNPGVYLTWHECSKQVLGFKNTIYKKYSSYEQAVVDFHALVRDFNAPLGAAPPLPSPLICPKMLVLKAFHQLMVRLIVERMC
jgi:hypothetical protein